MTDETNEGTCGGICSLRVFDSARSSLVAQKGSNIRHGATDSMLCCKLEQ